MLFRSRSDVANTRVAMSLDTITLYIVATMVAAMLGAMLLFFGSQEKNPALKWWGTAYLLGAASVALWTMASNTLGEMLSLALNAVGFVACGMVWNASRVFHGRKPNLPGLVLGAIAWVAAVTLLDPRRHALRLTIGAAIVAIYAALTANELWSERRKSLQRRWPAIAVPVLHGFVLMLPILLGDCPAAIGRDVRHQHLGHDVLDRTRALCGGHGVRDLHAGVGTYGHRAQERRLDRSPDRHVQSSRLCGGTSRVIDREAKAGRPVTVLIFDIDHFKWINDRFGHPAGDEILKLFSTVVVNTLRISDLSGRIGGEEFAALLPCSLEEGVLVAERVREAFETRKSWSRTGRSIPPSASVSPAGRRAPSSRCCWRRPTPRSTRPSAAAATGSRPRKNCRCRWKTGGARPPAPRVPQPRPTSAARWREDVIPAW